MYSRLVEDDMRELRQTVLNVLDAVAADDILAPLVMRLPEGRLADPIAFLQDAFAKTKRMEHFHRAAMDAVGLTEKQSAGLLVDDARLNVRKAGELSRQRQTSRSAANDEDVDFRRKRCSCARGRVSLRRVKDFRVAGLESVEMKLHEICFLPPQGSRYTNILALELCFGTAEEDRVYR